MTPPSAHPSSGQSLAALRESLRRIETSAGRKAGVQPLGLPPIDRILPEGGLNRAALHEILAEEGHEAAAEGFAAMLLGKLAETGPVLWCLEELGLYGPGLAAAGITPDRLILVRAGRMQNLLWALEEGLKTPGLGAVIGEPRSLDLTASRRLQLAAERSGVPCLVLLPAKAAGATAAFTRWHVRAVPSGRPLSVDERDFGLLRARLQVSLIRCRGAFPAEGEDLYGAWIVEEGTGMEFRPVASTLTDLTATSGARRTVSAG